MSHVSDIIWHLSFSDLLHLVMIISRSKLLKRTLFHFLWLSNIPLYINATFSFYLFIFFTLQYCIGMAKSHIFFIHSSVNEHLACFFVLAIVNNAVPYGSMVKESTCQGRSCRRPLFDPWIQKSPWRRIWQPTSVFLPGESHGQRSLEGCSPQGCRVRRDWACTHMDTGVHLSI